MSNAAVIRSARQRAAADLVRALASYEPTESRFYKCLRWQLYFGPKRMSVTALDT
jgi:hypothetical protein